MTNRENLQRDLIKPKQPQDKILELIEWVDENQSKIIKPFDGLSGTSVLVIGFFLIIGVAVNITVHDFAISASITLTSLAALIAYFSLVLQTSDKGIFDKQFNRAIKLRSFNDREKVLFKALIQIKNANEEIKLKTLYTMDKDTNGDIFTERNLLELLCK